MVSLTGSINSSSESQRLARIRYNALRTGSLATQTERAEREVEQER